MHTCEKCKRYVTDRHQCHRFEACIDYSDPRKPWSRQPTENEWNERYTTGDAEDAAEEYADAYDCQGDYIIIRNREGRVWVRDAEGLVTRWEIEAESVPHYRATAAK